MFIEHLVSLGTHGLDSSIQLSLIEIRFDLAAQKNDKLEVPYEIVRRIDGTDAMFHAVDKIDPSNYISTSQKAREALRTNPSIKFFRGIPVDKGRTQTTSLVKLLAVLYTSAWYKAKVEQGVLERDDARRRIISVSENINLKRSAEVKKNEMGAQLPVIGRTTAGLVVLGLRHLEDQDATSFLEVDGKTSVLLTNEIFMKKTTTQEEAKKSFGIVSFQLQTKSGRARNLYGKEQDILQLSAFPDPNLV